MAKDTDATIREYLAKIGSEGGKMRAKRHGKAELSRWAKLGGRPPKSRKAARTDDERENKR